MTGTAVAAVWFVMFAIMIRVLFANWVDEESPSGFYIFCCAVTEPIVAPTRRLLDRFPAVQELPIDLSYVATVIILIIVLLALQVF